MFNRKAVTQPGEMLGWSACLSLDLADEQEGQFLLQQMKKRATLTEKEILYLPPEVKDGALLSGVLASEGNLIECGITATAKEAAVQENENEIVSQPVPATTVEADEVQRVQLDKDEVEGSGEVSSDVLVDEQKPWFRLRELVNLREVVPRMRV